MKKPKKKHRNAFTILAKKRKAGKHKPKTKTRANGKNKQAELLKEVS